MKIRRTATLLERIYVAFLLIGTGRVVSLMTNLALALITGPVAWGAYSVVRSASEMGQIWARGSVEVTAFRHLSVTPAAVQWLVVLRLLYMGGGLVTASVLCTLAYLQWTNQELTLSDTLIALATFPMFVVASASNMFAAVGSTRALGTEQLVAPISRIVVFALLIIMTANSSLALAMSLFISASLAASISIFRLNRNIKTREVTKSASPCLPLAKIRWSEFITVGFSVFLVSLVSRFDVIIIGEYFGDRHAGNYALVAAAAGVVTLVSSVLARELAPAISQQISTADPAKSIIQARYERIGFVAASLLSIAVQAALAIFLPITKYTYTIELGFTASFLTLSYALTSSFGLAGFRLTMNGRYKTELSILVIQAVIFVLTSTIAAQLGYIWGVGVCALLASAITIMLRTFVLDGWGVLSGKGRPRFSRFPFIVGIVVTQFALPAGFYILHIEGPIPAFSAVIISSFVSLIALGLIIAPSDWPIIRTTVSGLVEKIRGY